jgi:hypothetical protein
MLQSHPQELHRARDRASHMFSRCDQLSLACCARTLADDLISRVCFSARFARWLAMTPPSHMHSESRSTLQTVLQASDPHAFTDRTVGVPPEHLPPP